MRRDLLTLLVCPRCRDGGLAGLDESLRDGEIACGLCDARYPVRHGIPILLPPGFDAAHIHDELDHKRGQAAYYDRGVAEAFEISRPHGAPAAYGWLLERKFSRGIRGLPPLQGLTVADVCAGSGMDAEMLARAGAHVLAIDISEGCALRAQARAGRYGLDYVPVVGDVEHLPLRDRGVDVAYVHDGLHHLDVPAAGLREMARVARHAVSVNEPADALLTAIAVRLGLALAREHAGNRVARLTARDAARELRRAGFDAQTARYLMYYRHEPGAVMRLASRPPAAAGYRAGVAALDGLLGRAGNKLQVTARRRRDAASAPASERRTLAA